MSDRKRLALVVANGIYDSEELSQLSAPTQDAQALAELLEDPEIGYFDEVDLLIDKPVETVRLAVAEFFSSRKRNELRLLYYSGHGLIDENRRLYLAARDTKRPAHLLSSTAIPATFITERMDYDCSKRQVLILDCCNSGAFEITGAKAGEVIGTPVEMEQVFGGEVDRGRIVLTATDSVQYAWEGDRFIGESKHSVFTHYLVQGLRTGAADRQGNGEITTQEWFDYAHDYVVEETNGQQTPRRWAYRQGRDFIIAKNPQGAVSKRTVNTRHLPDEGLFTDREEDLAALQELLANKKLVILEGLSGIGKTSLALHYAYRAACDYDAVIWHEVQVEDTLESVLVSIAGQLSDAGYDALLDIVTDPQKDWQNRATIFFDELSQENLLLVFDAFDRCLDDGHRPTGEMAALLEGLLSKKYVSRVLLTSKVRTKINPTHSGKYGLYELRGLEESAAVPMFLSLCKDVGFEASDDEASAVCRAADGHPFALKIIVGLLHQGYLLEELLDQMRNRVTEDYGQFLLDILYDRLSPAAQTLLETCSVYRRPVRAVAIKKLPADWERIHELLPYFLLEVEPRSHRYFMHTIVREYAYAKLASNEERCRRVHKAAGDYMAAVTHDPYRRRDDFQTIQRILDAQYHYRMAEDEAGIVATSAYIADELKPLVRKLYRDRKNALASQLYRAILAVNEQDAEMHYYYARILERQGGDAREIERHYCEAVKLLPNHVEMQMRYMVWLAEHRKYEEAHRAFSTAIKHRGGRDQIYVPYAKALHSARRLDEAAAVLEEGIQRVPTERDLAPLYHEYSQVLRAQGELEKAAAVLEEGIQRVPPECNLSVLYHEYSQVRRAQGELEKAAAVLEEGIQRVPPERGLAPLYQEYSQVRRAQGELEKAAAVLEEGIQRVPVDSVFCLYHEYSQVRRAQGELEKAAAVLEEGIQRVPVDSVYFLYTDYSQVRRAQGKLEKAAAVLEEGIQRVPHYNRVNLMCAQASLLFDEGKFAEMAELFDEATDFAPYSSFPHVHRACLHWIQNEVDAARAQFEAGLETDPGERSIIYHYYSAFLLQTETPESARQFIAQTHQLPPQSPEVEHRLSDLQSVRPEDLWSLTPSIADIPSQEQESEDNGQLQWMGRSPDPHPSSNQT